MNHEAVQERLSSYLDGDLSPEERAEVQAHLDGCDECREELELLKVTLDALHDLPVLAAPDGFADAVLERIPDGVAAAGEDAVVVPLKRKGPGALVWAPIAMAAAACLVIGVVWWQLPRLTGRGETTVDQAAPVVFAELEEKAAAPAGSTSNGRWEDDRAQLESAPPASGQAEFDGLADIPDAEPGAGADLTLEPEVSGASGYGSVSRSFDGEVAANEEAKAAEIRARGDLSRDSAPDTSGAAQRGAYYTEWEHREGAEVTTGDAVADLSYDGRVDDGFAPAPPPESTVVGGVLSDDGDDGVVDLEAPAATDLSAGLGASDKDDEYGFGGVSGERYDRDAGEVASRETERMRKEDEAYRRMYDAKDDAVVDTAALMTEESEEEDTWDADEILAEEPALGEFEDTGTVASKSAGSGRGASMEKKGRGQRARESANRDSDRRSKSQDSGPFRQTKAGAQQEPSLDDNLAAGTPAVTEALPAEDKAAAGHAEWTLQTTDAAVPYAVSELCDQLFSLRCAWGAPGHRPSSLGAQNNYQVVELHLLGAEYAAVQTRLRKLGSVLVRTEDIAMADADDPITVRLIIEYMP